MTPHHLEAFRALIVILGVAGLIFWRIAFKIIIGALIVLIAVLVGAFVFGFLQGIVHSL